MKAPEDRPLKVGDRIMVRGRPGMGVVATFLARKGLVETLWDDGGDDPMICQIDKLTKVD